jgi:hypothetical protein
MHETVIVAIREDLGRSGRAMNTAAVARALARLSVYSW